MNRLFTLFLVVLLSGCQSTRNMSSFDYLTKQNWILSEIAGNSAISQIFPDQPPMLSFSDSGGLSGSTGCNNFNGNYSLTDDGIKLDPGAMTRKMCPGDGEKNLLAALANVNSFDVSGDQLILKNGSEALLRFIPE